MALFVRRRLAHMPICRHGESLGQHRDTQSCSRAPRQDTAPVDKASLLADGVAHAGYWLLAPPKLAVGLCLDDETIRVAVGHRLSSNTSEP